MLGPKGLHNLERKGIKSANSRKLKTNKIRRIHFKPRERLVAGRKSPKLAREELVPHLFIYL